MIKIYWNVCNKCRKSKNAKISYIVEKTSHLSIVYSNFDHEYKKIFNEKESIEILKILVLITNIEEYRKICNHLWGKHRSRILLTNIDETRNHFIKEINQNELMSKKHKKLCRVLDYIEHLCILISIDSGCVFISVFASLVGIPIGFTSSSVGLRVCVITAGIKKCKSTIKKKKRKHDKKLLLAKYKLNNAEVLISKALTDSNINHDEFVLINNALKEYDGMNKEIMNTNGK